MTFAENHINEGKIEELKTLVVTTLKNIESSESQKNKEFFFAEYKKYSEMLKNEVDSFAEFLLTSN